MIVTTLCLLFAQGVLVLTFMIPRCVQLWAFDRDFPFRYLSDHTGFRFGQKGRGVSGCF